MPSPLMPLMWQVAQVGTNISRVVSVLGLGIQVQQSFPARQTSRRVWTLRKFRSASGPAPCGTGRRCWAAARSQPSSCAGCGKLVQVPIVPSGFGLPMLWHCSHPLAMADPPSELHERMRRTPRSARLVGFRKTHLLGSQPFLAINRRPRCRRVTAAQRTADKSARGSCGNFPPSAARWRSQIHDDLSFPVPCAAGGSPGSSRPSARAGSSHIRAPRNTACASGIRRIFPWRAPIPPGCSVSTLGRARLIRNAARISANAITTAMKTDRNDMHPPWARATPGNGRSVAEKPARKCTPPDMFRKLRLRQGNAPT